MNVEQFRILIGTVTEAIKGKELTPALGDELDRAFPPGGDDFKAIEAACHKAIEAGWMCSHGAPGMRYGRVIDPGPATGNFSVDVVDLKDVAGPHHSHPKGEVCMVMPLSPTARFDGKGAGWKVYPPDSAHNPTVTNGQALVLYLLPEGKISFTKAS